MKRSSNGSAAAVAILLIGFAMAVSWVAISPMILGPDELVLDGPLAPTQAAPAEPQALIEGIELTESFQLSQPRDPFRPLITEDSPVGGGNGDTFDPDSIRVQLISIREDAGVRRATVSVDGVEYDVGVGDTFADGQFVVVSIDVDSAVFLFGDNAFELSVGQVILK